MVSALNHGAEGRLNLLRSALAGQATGAILAAASGDTPLGTVLDQLNVPVVTLDPGMTPLVSAPALAAAVGLRAPLFVKDDSANPTHSFKDRVVSVALTAARGLGFSRFA